MPIRHKLGAPPAGTNLRDTLDAIAEGNVLHGLGGRDLLRSTFDRTSLFGDGANDRLVTRLSFEERSSALAKQWGGDGNDSLTIRIDLSSTAESPVKSGAFLYGDAGNDVINVRNLAAAAVLARVEAVNNIDGGTGDDVIDAKAHVDGVPSSSYATNNILGGTGNDRISALADGDFSGLGTYSTNNIDAGDGDDFVDATASVNSNGGYFSKNYILGGLGDDVIRATVGAGSNDAIVITENTVHGGDGDDVLDLSSGTAFSTIATLRTVCTGGIGDDDITSAMTANAMQVVNAVSRINAQSGDDRIESNITSDSTGESIRIQNRILGGEGTDELIARIETSLSGQVTASNRLDGEAGNDTLTAEVIGQGRTILYGGSGNDILRAVGGNDNLLVGGSNEDRLFAGSGNDSLIGDSGLDDFIFDVSTNQGTDRLLDFDDLFDRLCFSGITDNGVVGIADDLDAITTLLSEDAGGDVIVTFDSGSVLRFVGCAAGLEFRDDPVKGPGSYPVIDSIADLVANAQTQLLIEA